MNPTLKELGVDLMSIERMSIEERWLLAQEILDSITRDMALTDAQRAELDRRIAAADANPNEGIPWDVIRAEAKARWQR